MSHPTPLHPDMTFRTWTDEQIAAFEDRIVQRVTEELASCWLPREPMTPDDLASYLHVSRETIRRWTVAGDISAWQHGHTILYLPDDIAVFLGRGYRESEAA